MKKLVATGTVALMLMGAASPALAQDAVAVDDSVAQGGDVLFLDASQFQFAAQIQAGDAVADDDGVAIVASDQSIVQNQINAGLGDVDDVNQGVDGVGDFFWFD